MLRYVWQSHKVRAHGCILDNSLLFIPPQRQNQQLTQAYTRLTLLVAPPEADVYYLNPVVHRI